MTDDDEVALRRRAERRADAKIAFRTHFLTYVLVNAGLAAINYVTSPGDWWVVWPMFGWGIGLFAHGVATFVETGDMRERQIEKELRRLRARRGA